MDAPARQWAVQQCLSAFGHIEADINWYSRPSLTGALQIRAWLAQATVVWKECGDPRYTVFQQHSVWCFDRIPYMSRSEMEIRSLCIPTS